MAYNYGKKFEEKFKSDWLKLDNSDCVRLKDIMSGYKKIKNVCDFICYLRPNTFYLDCKSLEGNTFNFSKLTQWDDMVKHMNKPGVNVGAIIWFIDHKVVCYVPIEEFVRLKKLGYKSIHIKMVDDYNFNVYRIPGVPKRLFIDSDYSVMNIIAESRFKELTNE